MLLICFTAAGCWCCELAVSVVGPEEVLEDDDQILLIAAAVLSDQLHGPPARVRRLKEKEKNVVGITRRFFCKLSVNFLFTN